MNSKSRFATIVFMIPLLFLLFPNLALGAEIRQIWLHLTEDSKCNSSLLTAFELGDGKRLQLLSSPNSPLSSHKQISVSFHKGEVLVFTEGVVLQPLGEQVRLLYSSGKYALRAGPKDSLRSLHSNASTYVIKLDPSHLEPKTCIDFQMSSELSRFESARSRPFLPRMLLPFFAPLSIDSTFLINAVREYSGDLETHTGRILERGTVRGREMGQTYLSEEFSKLGLKVEKQCFSAGSNKGCNIIGILPGKTENVVVVSAHADSVKNAGADDDGSGIAALLAIAKSMKSSSWNATLHFVGFDLEEVGLVGSKAYVKELLKRKTFIKGNINLEMLGYDSDNDGVFHVIDCKRKESLDLVNLVKQTAQEKNNLKVSPYCTNRSDHASFWDAGIPAVVISQNFFGGDVNPCYHAACDKFDKINSNYFYNLVELSANIVSKFADRN
jgi:hypothetical protein